MRLRPQHGAAMQREAETAADMHMHTQARTHMHTQARTHMHALTHARTCTHAPARSRLGDPADEPGAGGPLGRAELAVVRVAHACGHGDVLVGAEPEAVLH